MIPYWIVLCEADKAPAPGGKGYLAEARVAYAGSYEEAKGYADEWQRTTRSLKWKTRATISGPFYRDGFK